MKVCAAALWSAILWYSSSFSIGTAQVTGPSSPNVPPYLTSRLSGVTTTSLITVDGGTADNGYQLVGIPDGLAVADGPELGDSADVFYLWANHELAVNQGAERAHGGIGAFVSQWRIDKTTLRVLEGSDLIQTVQLWDYDLEDWVPSNNTSFNRFCSSDRPAPTALFNSATGLGTQELLYFNGEETSGGRGFGHVLTGPDAGTAFHLPHIGYLAFENIVACPFEQDLTIAMAMDDSSNGEVYVYVGTKTNTGNDVTRAGFVGGTLYALAVEGKPYEVDDVVALNLMDVERFQLKLVGEPGNYPTNGLETTANGLNTTLGADNANSTLEALKFAGPEDGSWDPRPGFQNIFYFVSKGSTVNGRPALSRVWRLTFDDIGDPTAGGTLEQLIQYPGSFDNVRVSDDGTKLYIQEDLDNDPTLSRVLEWDLATDTYEEVASFSSQIFFPGGDSFLTQNEESSGIISLESILGPGYYAMSAQVHTPVGLSDPDTQVEHGQILLMNVGANRESDVLRTVVVEQYTEVAYKVDGMAADPSWANVDFTLDPSWVSSGGITPIGYGEAPGVLNTDVGQPDVPRPLAYFFRATFDLPDPEVVGFNLLMRYDDGAVVYINGVEVARGNMPTNEVVTNITRASTGIAGEDQWRVLTLGCLSGITFLATGNVLAVSIHQEGPGSSDFRFQTQLEAWTASPDFPPPADPTGFQATNASISSVTLEWDPVDGVDFYLMERMKPAEDVVYTALREDIPGDFSMYVDENDIEDGVEYMYRLTAVSLGGRSECVESNPITTPEDDTPIQFSENFAAADSFGQFTYINFGDSSRGFTWRDGAIQGNGFGGESPTEDWLILTHPLNFHLFREHALVFESLVEFSGPFPEWRFSSNYDPSTMSDPLEANWTTIFVDSSADPVLTAREFDMTGIATEIGYFGVYYTSTGTGGGESVRYTFDNVQIQGECGFDFAGAEATDIAADPNTPWTVVNIGSEFGWQYDTNAGEQGAFNNNFGSGVGGTGSVQEADDWLISPSVVVASNTWVVEFDYYERFGDAIDQPLALLVTESYTGDVSTTEWTDITPLGIDGSTDDAWVRVASQPIPFVGNDLVLAFRYRASGAGGGTTKRIGVDFVCVADAGGPLVFEATLAQRGGIVTTQPVVSGGVPPYTYEWAFGDGGAPLTESAPVYTYTAPGSYPIVGKVTDSIGDSRTQELSVTVTDYQVPAKVGSVRVATFNVAFSDAFPNDGEMEEALKAPGNTAITGEAEIIKASNPDILFLNEWNHKWKPVDESTASDAIKDGSPEYEFDLVTTKQGLMDFVSNYLSVGENPVNYDYIYVAPCNTGVQSGFDFSRDGTIGDGGDAYGFGDFYGRYSMAILSKYPIDEESTRTFQKFLWKDMPDAYLPADPNDVNEDGDTTTYYTTEELEVFRLSSKSHWDVVVELPDGEVLHLLGSHPTPPVFDDGTATEYPSAELADWNGYRNHDEIRFWWDYVDPATSSYIYDDAGTFGGLTACDRFVIVGDLNADPIDGDSTLNPAESLLSSSFMLSSVDENGYITPTSPGAVAFGLTGEKTSEFGLRVDYSLPSSVGFESEQSFVYWPEPTDLQAPNADSALYGSDHRMVVSDLTLAVKSADCSEATTDPPTDGAWTLSVTVVFLMSSMVFFYVL